MSMPGWALGLGAALKGPEVISDYMGLFKNIQAMRDESNASDAMDTLAQFQTSADVSRYKPSGYMSAATKATLAKLQEDQLKKLQGQESIPIIDRFSRNNGEMMGDSGVQSILPSTVVSQSEMQNPAVRTGVDDFIAKKRNIMDLFSTSGGDRMAGARIAAQSKDLSTGFKSISEGQKDYAGMDEKATGARNLADFRSSISGLSRPSERTGQMIPYGDVTELVQQAASDYPVKPEVVNQTIDNLMKQYEVSNKPAAGRTEEQLTAAAINGDKGAQAVLDAMQRRKVEIAKQSRPPRSINNFTNPVAQSTFVDPASGKPLVFDKKTGSYRVANVEGDVAPKPSAFSPEAAAKSQLVEQGLTYIPTIRAGMLGDDGKIDRVTIANIGLRTPFTKGREMSTLILDAVEAKLRAESGAAVPEPEVKRAAKRFVPQVADSDSTINLKINNLEKFLKGTADKINIGRSVQSEAKTPGKAGLNLDMDAIDAAIARKRGK